MYLEKGSVIMLIQFKFKNHKSFYEESILDMTATAEKRHLLETIDVNGNKLLPFVAIYGSNASGKSTLISAFNTMTSAVVKSYDIDVNQLFPVSPFTFNKKYRSQPSEFEISLALNNFEYRYGFVATWDGIKEEWLYKKPFKANTKAKQKIMFERSNNEVEFNKSLQDCEQIKSIMNNKSLVLSILGRRNEESIKEIYNWFLQNYLIVDNMIINKDNIFKMLHEKKELAQKFNEFLNEFDPCLKGLRIEPVEDENQRVRYIVNGIHNDVDGSDNIYYMPLRGESAGTNKIIEFLPIMLTCLEKGGTLFVDELDTKLHPLLYKKIIYMFNDKNLNKKNAQLIFTAHNTFMFNSENVRRDQIYLVEKDKLGQSKLYSLADFKNLRVDADYEKKYFTGEFGAIPFIEE